MIKVDQVSNKRENRYELGQGSEVFEETPERANGFRVEAVG
jgi:hypothetical protein